MNPALFLTTSEQDQIVHELEQIVELLDIDDFGKKYPTLNRLCLELDSHWAAHRARYVE